MARQRTNRRKARARRVSAAEGPWGLTMDLSRYAGEWVSVRNRRVVAHGRDVAKLIPRMRGKMDGYMFHHPMPRFNPPGLAEMLRRRKVLVVKTKDLPQ